MSWAYPEEHWALRAAGHDAEGLVGVLRTGGHRAEVLVHPLDRRGYRLVVRLADEPLAAAFNRPPTASERDALGAALALASAAMARLGLTPQVSVLGNNSHAPGRDGAVALGNAHEPWFPHGHVVGRGDPARPYAPGAPPLLGPPPGELFPFRSRRVPWEDRAGRAAVARALRAWLGPRRVIFVRHGQTAHNAAGLLQGRQNPPLSGEGAAQAAAAAETVAGLLAAAAGEGPASVVSSSLLRALQTASAVVTKLPGGARLSAEPLLAERALGEHEGRAVGSVPRDWPRDRPLPGGGESLDEFEARVARGWEAVLGSASGGRTAVVVAHGGVWLALAQQLALSGPALAKPRNCEVRTLLRGDDGVSWTCTLH